MRSVPADLKNIRLFSKLPQGNYSMCLLANTITSLYCVSCMCVFNKCVLCLLGVSCVLYVAIYMLMQNVCFMYVRVFVGVCLMYVCCVYFV